MMRRNGRVFRARLDAFLSTCTCLLAFLLAEPASAQTKLSQDELTKAVQLLQTSFACAIPVYQPAEEGNWVGQIHDTDSYVGDSQKFKLFVDRHQTIIGGSSRTSATRDHLLEIGKYADFSGITLGDGFIGGQAEKLKNSVVTITCHSGTCFTKECTNTADVDGCGTDANPDATTVALSSLSIQVCSASTASDIKFAMGLLTKANQPAGNASLPSGSVEKSISKETSAPEPAEDQFRVPQNVPGGILNMRRGPGVEHRIIVAIPAGTDDVSVGTCRSSDTGKGKPWCKADWNGHSGWVSSCCIFDDGTGLPPKVEH